MQYLSKYGKSYFSFAEFDMRLALYNKTDKFIKKYNSEEGHTFEVGHNKFSDWTEYELKRLNGYKRGKYSQERSADVRTTPDMRNVPVSIDWRERNAVTAVKDQQHCGSCWTFATSAVLEGAHAIRTGQLLSFSEQLWLDCDLNERDYG